MGRPPSAQPISDPESQSRPFLPPYSRTGDDGDTEKQGSDFPSPGAFDESTTHLHLGGGSCRRLEALKAKVRTWSGIKRFIATAFLGLLALLGLKSFAPSFEGRYRDHRGAFGREQGCFEPLQYEEVRSRHLLSLERRPLLSHSRLQYPSKRILGVRRHISRIRLAGGRQRDWTSLMISQLSFSPAVFSSPITNQGYTAASASFAVDPKRWIAINLEGSAVNLVISRLSSSEASGFLDEQDAMMARLMIESMWIAESEGEGEGEQDQVVLATGDWSSRLNIKVCLMISLFILLPLARVHSLAPSSTVLYTFAREIFVHHSLTTSPNPPQSTRST